MSAKAPRQDTPDPTLDAAVAAFRRLCRHVPHGRVMVLVERDQDVTLGYETGAGRSIPSDIARFMSETPHRSEVGR